MSELTLIAKRTSFWTTKVLTEHCFVFLRIWVHWLFVVVTFLIPYRYIKIHAHFYRLIYCALFDVFNELRENPESRLAKRKLKGLLNRNSQFAAFKRNYVRTNYDEQSEYMQYLK